MAGTEDLADACAIVTNFEFTEELVDEAEQIVSSDTKPLPQFWQDKYRKDGVKNWDLFYKRNEANFFKDRNWLPKEFAELRDGQGELFIAPALTSGIASLEARKAGESSGAGRFCDQRLLVVEIGCGVGNALLPILRNNRRVEAIGFDCSARGIDFFKKMWNARHADEVAAASSSAQLVCGEKEKIAEGGGPLPNAAPDGKGAPAAESLRDCGTAGPTAVMASPTEGDGAANAQLQMRPGRLRHLFVWDITKGSVPAAECPAGSADVGLLLFVLSAIPPEHHAAVAVRCAELLKPGGVLLFRDYGRYDMCQLKFAKSKKAKIEDNFYIRLEGTFAYYFTTEELRRLFCEGAGLLEEENSYCLKKFVNRKTKAELRRVWIQSKFRKPDHV